MRINLKMLLIIMLLMTVLPTLSQEKNDKIVNSLEMSISVEDRCYTLKDSIKLGVTLQNNTKHPIFIYKNKEKNPPKGFDVLLYNSQNHLVGNENPIRLIPVRDSKVDDYVKIEPEKSILFNLSFTLRERRANKIDKFFIIGFYQSPVFREMLPQELKTKKVWTFEDKNIYSSKIELKIANKCS